VNLTDVLSSRGAYFCLLELSVRGFSSFGNPISLSQAPAPASSGLDQATLVLTAFLALGGLLVLAFLLLQLYTMYADSRDRTRYLYQFRPVGTVFKHGNAWRYEDPVHKLLVAFPSDINEQLQNSFVHGWLEKYEPTVRFALAGVECEANFSTMQVRASPREPDPPYVPSYALPLRWPVAAGLRAARCECRSSWIVAGPPGGVGWRPPPLLFRRIPCIAVLLGRA
jgi:hypothetical protein